ncbi:MAG: glycosyltransferase family 2 protein [Planctomycetota bacterium]
MTGPTRPRVKKGLTSIVVPLLNEAASLWRLYEEIVRAVPGELEILFVDDGSTDESFTILCAMQERDARVRAFRLRGRRGKAVALAVGFYFARGDSIVTLDADLQDDPGDIPLFLAKLEEGYDVVSGHRLNRQDTRFRKVASVVFNVVASLMCGHRFHDMAGGFKAYRPAVVKELRLHGGLHRFIPVLAAARGFRATELRVVHRPRPHGGSRYGASRYLHAFVDCLAVVYDVRFGTSPGRPFTILGLGIIALGGLMAIAVGSRVGLAWRVSLVSLHTVAGLLLLAQGLVAERARSAPQPESEPWPLREVLEGEVLEVPPGARVNPAPVREGVRG